jgi:hypothetical protein
MSELADLISRSEGWLMCRVLEYARRFRYSQYTSTLEEAWRISIQGLSRELLAALNRADAPPELDPDMDFTADPMAAFGVLEAQRHRSRGISLAMFMGLMKYYRQAYLDLIVQNRIPATAALAQVRQLSGLLPICASCKKIRDDQGYWTRIEEYITDHSEADFSHGLCPECLKKLYPDQKRADTESPCKEQRALQATDLARRNSDENQATDSRPAAPRERTAGRGHAGPALLAASRTEAPLPRT